MKFAQFNWDRSRLRPKFSPSPPPTNGGRYEVSIRHVDYLAADRCSPLYCPTGCWLDAVGSGLCRARDVTTGWSTKRQVLGKNVFNDKGETIGKIDDIIVAPDKAVSYAIIGAGGFLGMGRHDVADSGEPAQAG